MTDTQITLQSEVWWCLMGRVRKKHPREFKIEAVRKLQSGEVSLAELSRRLSVSASELCEWRKQLEEKKGDAFPG